MDAAAAPSACLAVGTTSTARAPAPTPLTAGPLARVRRDVRRGPLPAHGLRRGLRTNPPWAIFSTPTDDELYARTQREGRRSTRRSRVACSALRTATGSTGTPSSVVLRRRRRSSPPTRSPFGSLRRARRATSTPAAALVGRLVRMTPYSSSGTFASRVLDAGSPVDWGNAHLDGRAPVRDRDRAGVRTGDTPSPTGAGRRSCRSPRGHSPAAPAICSTRRAHDVRPDGRRPARRHVGYGANDTTAPTIAARTPAPGATGVRPARTSRFGSPSR